MTNSINSDKNSKKIFMNHKSDAQIKDELILCQHCLRTANNGIKCKGICVADSDY
ncbi:hypothetical protein [Geminocystis sp. NIES-3708]|uniref:hypothetical protein n=1 Tax=Geminocystis sp. NIES-3708 TaxID=1615909 RepID=UPI00156AD1B4|nr:hypothetical protein [Geminocystis sp. NIES-3708]